jgi:hypothetical protein
MADLWHYTSEGKRMEPVTGGELRQLATAGFLRPDDLVWKQGMTEWAPASSVSGLFSADLAVASAVATPADEPPATFEVTRPAPQRRSEIDEDDAPQRRRRRSADDDAPRRRSPQKATGPNWGLIVGLIVGGVVVLVVVAVAIGVAISLGGGNRSFEATLQADRFQTQDFFFKGNTAYQFLLTGDPGPDVSIYLTDLNNQTLRSGNFVAADATKGPNHRIVWIFPVGGIYRVKIHNLGPPICRSRVDIRELGPGRAIEVPFVANPPIMPKMPFPKLPLPMLPPPGPVGPAVAVPGNFLRRSLPALGSGQECEFTVTYPAARQVTIDVTTIERQPDVDLFVYEVGGPRSFMDESIGPDSHVTFQAQPGRTYRFVVKNVTDEPSIANSSIVYTSP